LVEKSVGGNIFRAFSLENLRGSEIYRNWASKNFRFILNDLKCQILRSIMTPLFFIILIP
jgi:hypothetical protein